MKSLGSYDQYRLEKKKIGGIVQFTRSQNLIRDTNMTQYGSTIKTSRWITAAFFALLIFGCGDGGQIFGGGGGGGGVTVNNPGPAGAAPALGAAASFAGLGSSSAGMTNTGTLTQINNGDLAATTVSNSAISGFHDSAGDIYNETAGANIGAVSGKIYTCTNSSSGPTVSVNAASCTLATNAANDAMTAFNDLSPASRPGGLDVSTCPGCGGGGAGELGGRTLAPGVYKSAPGTYGITLGDLTLDAQGNANAVWVFQMATTLTVGGAAFTPKSVILINGAQAKNVFWYVGTAAHINEINAGGTMVGSIFAGSAITISTVGQLAITTLNGRAIALGAQATINNTIINLP
jgi:hypothetical protein